MSNQVDEISGKTSKNKKGAAENVELKKEIDVLKVDIEESKDKYLRLFAEFDNYKKRNVKERFELIKTAAQETITALLPVLDDFDRAKKSAEDGIDTFSEGVQLVYHKLFSILEQKGLKSMESTGADFDPEWHEAIADIPAPNEELRGKIIDTIEKGYILHDKIIRYAKVVVAR